MSAHNFNFIVSAEIPSETIKQIIKTAVEEQTGRKVRDVIFKVTTKSYGFPDGCSSPELSGCTVHFD
jgi:hypothetical protein